MQQMGHDPGGNQFHSGSRERRRRQSDEENEDKEGEGRIPIVGECWKGRSFSRIKKHKRKDSLKGESGESQA
jgi:hypothetical protein